ncbi:MAG: hypothetical protein GC181_05525 [Bacteroidetes bacterium]|nr:hypothetical protein [Bacteroidota bacterium]
MRKTAIILVSLIALVAACNKKPVQQQEAPDIYEPSELALLMRKMEFENQLLRKQILEGADSFTFPSAYKNLTSSKPTTPGTVNQTFKEHSAAYALVMEQLQSGDSSMTYRFNKGVDACIDCHHSFCGGPIPRIEKLRITSSENQN